MVKREIIGNSINFDNIYNDLMYLLQEQEENNNTEDEDSNINYRNKDKERVKIENEAKNKLSKQAVDAINKNEKEMDEIIDNLQHSGVEYNGNGINLSKIKSRLTQRRRSL